MAGVPRRRGGTPALAMDRRSQRLRTAGRKIHTILLSTAIFLRGQHHDHLEALALPEASGDSHPSSVNAKALKPCDTCKATPSRQHGPLLRVLLPELDSKGVALLGIRRVSARLHAVDVDVDGWIALESNGHRCKDFGIICTIVHLPRRRLTGYRGRLGRWRANGLSLNLRHESKFDASLVANFDRCLHACLFDTQLSKPLPARKRTCLGHRCALVHPNCTAEFSGEFLTKRVVGCDHALLHPMDLKVDRWVSSHHAGYGFQDLLSVADVPRVLLEGDGESLHRCY
eukprot:scaffold105868_cov28-Tisochrysis_lutea.AAC.1